MIKEALNDLKVAINDFAQSIEKELPDVPRNHRIRNKAAAVIITFAVLEQQIYFRYPEEVETRN